jgi:hypothetical protein
LNIKTKKRLKVFLLLEMKSDDLSFCVGSGEEWISPIMESSAGIILCKYNMRNIISSKSLDKQLVFVNNPRLAFIRIVKYAAEIKK